MRLLLYEWCCSGGIQSDIAHDILQKTLLEDFLKDVEVEPLNRVNIFENDSTPLSNPP